MSTRYFSDQHKRLPLQRLMAITLGFVCPLLISPLASADGNMSDYTAIPPTISTTGSGDMANILVILDNSNSMDEAPTGAAVGSDNPGSKSEIARGAVKSLITTFTGKIRMGLMAYQQSGIQSRHLHDSQYDMSYDPANYDADSTANRDSGTKKYRVPNPTSAGNYLHYNVSLPFYSSSNQGNAFCFSSTADFDNGSETYPAGPWDTYKCFTTKTGTSDTLPTNSGQETSSGYSGLIGSFSFSPTDSDLAQNILDFGTFLTWQHVGSTWFSNSSPGRGYLHVPIDDLDATQASLLNAKLATSQFSTNTDTPLRNAGLTPIEGTLLTAKDYFAGTSLANDEGGPTTAPPANSCANKDYVILVTDGLPSTDKDGNTISDTTTAITAASQAAADLLATGVRTYVVGFALPEGVSPTILDDVASAGGTGTAFSASDSASLNSALQHIFLDVLNRTSAASTASVVSNSSTGIGAFFQALYTPRLELTNASTNVSSTVTWTGTLHSLFVDDYGYLREDSDGDHKLDGYDVDKIVKLEYMPGVGRTQVVRRNSTSSTTPTGLTDEPPVEVDELNTLWNARDELSAYNNLTTQRTYSNPANPGNTSTGDRYVFTWIDNDTTGISGSVDSSEVIDFTNNTISASNYRYLGVSSETDADNIVDYVRGKEISGYRNRTIDYDQDGTDEVWRLGDIVHSSPVVVGAPNEAYSSLYGDNSYATFKAAYANRRQMIYVGANDGMLHAFNGGFWNETNKSFDTTSGTLPAHALGGEMWAYVPQNLLPHLQWLKDTNYNHVYFMDGPPLVFDARIFSDDTDHPGGWGTVLVVGMRLGGGDFSIDTDGDSVNDTVMRSAYVILDITNPEADPKTRLLAEITAPDLGFTTSKPAVIKSNVPTTAGLWTGGTSEWHLVFGSGPNILGTVTSDRTAKLYVYNLKTRSFESGFSPLDLNESNSFVGDIATRDWNLDYIDDGAYFGIVGGTTASPSGKIVRLKLDTATPANVITSATRTDLLNPGRPFISAPSFTSDTLGRRWVYAGTGRLFDTSDNSSTAQQGFYGVKEPVDSSTGAPNWATVNISGLQNVTNIQVFDDGSILPSPTTVGTTSVTNFTELVGAMTQKDGWYRNFSASGERNITKSVNFRTLLLYTSYFPSTNICDPEGTSYLHVAHFQTGTALPHGAIGFDSSITNNSALLSDESIEFGHGTAGEIQTYMGDGLGGDQLKAGSGTSTGAYQDTEVTTEPVASGRRSWREIDIN